MAQAAILAAVGAGSFLESYFSLEPAIGRDISVEMRGETCAQLCLTLGDPVDCSTPGFSVHHPVPNPSQHQNLFQRVNSSHEVPKVLEFQ